MRRPKRTHSCTISGTPRITDCWRGAQVFERPDPVEISPGLFEVYMQNPRWVLHVSTNDNEAVTCAACNHRTGR